MRKIPRKRQNFIYENFKIGLRDLSKIKVYFWFSFLLFFFIALIGFLFPSFFEEKILEIIRELIGQTEGLGVFGLIRFIMANNMKSAFLGIFLGIFLGVAPLGIIIVNAYILGFVANKSIAVGGFLILWRLLPHGIFEIPAILISLALGLKLGFSLMNNCIKHYNKKISSLNSAFLMFLSILFLPVSFIIYMTLTLTNLKLKEMFFRNITDSFRIFILIVVPLLVIAGIIEGVLIWGLS